MKQQRLRVKLLALVLFSLFLLLGVYGGYTILTNGNRWFASSRNVRVRSQKASVIAGNILDRNGVVLATTVEKAGGDGTVVRERVYQDDEAARRAIVHLVGDSEGQVSNSVESFQTSYLYGFRVSFPEMVANLFTGSTLRGDDVTLTVSSELCTQAVKAFEAHDTTAGKRGAVFVLNYRTGETLASVSLPNFDPMNIPASGAEGQPFWNRVTQSLYPPGSTFKIVTAAAALENIPGIENLEITCAPGVLDFGEHFISDYGSEVHGPLRMREAFIRSCNKLFAQYAVNVGTGKLRAAAEQAGFNENFLFRDLVVENSSFPSGSLTPYELAAAGFGQASIVATPVHMCMIAAAVANDGVMMEPRLLRTVTGARGVRRLSFSTNVYRRAFSAETAAILQGYMRDVITSGTGRRAAVSGLTVCGKTGTSDSTEDGSAITYGWFVGYAADEELPVAVSVVVEGLDENISGGSSAALIAHDLFAWIRDNRALVLNP